MGFSLKKAFKSVAKVATAPVRITNSITKKALDVTGLDSVASKVGIDTNNLFNQTNSLMKGDIRTGSDEFKNAAFDGVKIGLAAAGAGGAIMGSTAAAGFAVTTKAQNGGGITLGDLGAVTGVPTDIGGVNLGNIGVVSPKPVTTTPVNNVWPDYLSNSTLPTSLAQNNNTFIFMAFFGFILLSGIMLMLTRKR